MGTIAPLLILGLLAPTAPDSSGGGPPRAALSAPELRARLLAETEKIKSLRLSYRSYDYDSSRFPKGSYLHRTVVAKSPCSFHHVSAHGHDAMDWRDDPFQQRAYVTERHFFNDYRFNRTFAEGDLRPEDGLPGSLPGEFLFLATGIWPLERRAAPRPAGRVYVLREVARSEEYSAVRPELERVDGRWCHVLEAPGLDRLWLDVGRGCALLARETHIERGGPLAQRIDLTGHREVAPGIWLPARMHNVQFDHGASTAEGRRRKVIDADFTVLEARVDAVDDATFRFDPPPGSLRLAPDGTMAQARPGGLDHLDHLARAMAGPEPPIGRESPVPIGALALVPAVLLVVASEVRRRRDAGPAAPGPRSEP